MGSQLRLSAIVLCAVLCLTACSGLRKAQSIGTVGGRQESTEPVDSVGSSAPEEPLISAAASDRPTPVLEATGEDSPPVPPDQGEETSFSMFLGTDFNIYDYDTMTRNVIATQSIVAWIGTHASNEDIEAVMREHGVDPAPYLNNKGFAYGFNQYGYGEALRQEIVMEPTGKYDPYTYMDQHYDALRKDCNKFLTVDCSIYDNTTLELDLALTDSFYSWFSDFEAALPREIALVMLQHGVNPESYLNGQTFEQYIASVVS